LTDSYQPNPNIVTLRLTSILIDNPELRRLTEGAQQIQALQQHYQQFAQPFILNSSRILRLDQHILVIVADNGTVAAKLRQLAPEFIGLFQERGYEVTGIQVEVQVRFTPSAASVTKRSLSAHSKQELFDLSEKLSDSPLKQAIDRLVRNKN
jgi:hypothetical protein